ncbi:MAG: hypothetical protein J7K33_12670 [Candidatus Marinimicrobia bacterium]|nr:hypothetical protein [Candidatus Neomarinimicrobiota bacterium]
MMNLAILDFRRLLTLIYEVFGTGEFTSRELSDRLRGGIMSEPIKSVVMLHPSSPKIYRRFSRKMISNDLRRLYAMGFLKRRKVKRKCRTKSGKICYRGYEYKYSLSSQGLKYLVYMARGGEEEEEWEGLGDLIIKIMLKKKAPEEVRDILWEFYQTQLKERKGFRRSSTSQMAFWDKVLECVTEISRDKKIKSLEERVNALKEENQELREEIKRLEIEKAEYKRAIKELSRMSIKMMEITDRLLETAGYSKEEDEEYREISKRARKVLAKLTSMMSE